MQIKSRHRLINIFEVVLNNSIFSALCGNEVGHLSITKEQFNRLNGRLMKENLITVSKLISRAFERVVAGFRIRSCPLKEYIDNYKELFKKRVFNALDNGSLSNLVVVEEEDREKYAFTFGEGERMDEKSFEKVVDRILRLPEAKDKINVINSSVGSLQDFLDILNADCFYGEGFLELFSTLGEFELTILAKIVFYEELREGQYDLSELVSSKKTVEAEWQEYLVKYLCKMDIEKKNSINKLFEKIYYEEIKFD